MSRNVAHNDLWKADSRMSTLYKVEFVVSSGGRLRAIDFNTGTVNGSYACVAGGRTTALPASLEPYFTPVSDGDVLNVLDAMFLVNRTLESYAAKNIIAVQGVCSLPLVLSNSRGQPLTEVAKYHSQENGTCEDSTATAKGGEFGIIFKAHQHSAHQSMVTARYLPSGVNLPSTADVRACVERCAACSECTAVSVSTVRRACLWSNQPCVPIDSSHSLRTVYRARGKPRIPLDDFVTVQLRGGDRATTAIASADGLLAGFFAYRQFAGGSSPGNEAAKSKWSWRGHYQDSHTLLKLAEKPNAGTTKALQRGRRHVDERLSLIKSHLNLKGKSVLELGSNLGMNLLELRGSLSWAVGCDINPLAVNQANYLASVLDVGKAFRFYTFNLNTEPASVLQTFLPGGRADVLFIFSVNAYVDNFAKLLDTLEASVAPSTFVIELNALGDDERAIEREANRLRSRPHFTSVTEITNYTACADCKLNKGRLFVCSATP